MTEAAPDAIGPDGQMRLRCYLPLEKSLWFFAGCHGCGHSAPICTRAAIRFAGSAEATVGGLERRLRCSNRQVGVTVHPDTRPAEMQASGGAAA